MNSEQEAEEPPKKVARIEQEETPKIIEKVDRNNEDISVPNWLIEMLTWIERTEMANSGLTTSSWVFQQLCGPKLHGLVEPHAVGPLDLVWEQDAVSRVWRGIARYGDKLLTIPSTPPPDYITGFKRIRIHHLDDRVLEFMKCIAPKLDGIKFVMKMGFYGWKWNVRDGRSRAIQCLLNALAGRIDQFHFALYSNFKMFNWHFRHFINHCQCIFISDVLPRFSKPEFNVLFKWLTNRQHIDATKQKVLMFTPWTKFAYFFGRIKEEFANATDPLNFFVIFGSSLPEYDLDLENKNTGEVMYSYWNEEIGGRMILRCQKGQEERWKNEGENKMRALTASSDDVTKVKLDIKHFGKFTDDVA